MNYSPPWIRANKNPESSHGVIRLSIALPEAKSIFMKHEIEEFINAFEIVFDNDWTCAKGYLSNIRDGETLLSVTPTGNWTNHKSLIQAYIDVKKALAKAKMEDAIKVESEAHYLEKDFLTKTS